jgi:hypothetical protein
LPKLRKKSLKPIKKARSCAGLSFTEKNNRVLKSLGSKFLKDLGNDPIRFVKPEETMKGGAFFSKIDTKAEKKTKSKT